MLHVDVMQLAAEHEKAMLTKIRQSQGIIETKEDRERDKERKRVADKFEDMRKERHWSEKKRSEMTERDWRIFREDFNIAYKACTPYSVSVKCVFTPHCTSVVMY